MQQLTAFVWLLLVSVLCGETGRFDPAAEVGMIKYGAILERLRTLLRAPVDLVGEPARTARLQAEIDRDRAAVF